MKRIADGEPWTTPPTIDDAGVLDEIGASLRDRGIGSV
jgi:propionyl-CoA synthetase